ncbi:ribonuclease H-like protein [Wolfiporia cocos MD-104 SS10]|uniref:ribonuclease H n=1 Tax=Wolfiporia cocos (strain MD-104) TaxID=742152 RepID=A0A2H3JC16_WOLCO|nr:ribonuclease H-like protein [Wolfiporia cocos MD-104 SS10]
MATTSPNVHGPTSGLTTTYAEHGLPAHAIGPQAIINRQMRFCDFLLETCAPGQLSTTCPMCGRFIARCCAHYKYINSDVVQCHDWMVVFTDGACLSNGRRSATAGIGVAIGTADEHQWAIPIDDDVDDSKRSSQRAELLAAIEGLRLLSKTDRDHTSTAANLGKGQKRTGWIITTDSEYVVKGMTLWLPNWRANRWRGTNGKEPANLDLFRKLEAEIMLQEELYAVDVGFWHIKRKYNSMADCLAKAAAQHAPPASA